MQYGDMTIDALHISTFLQSTEAAMTLILSAFKLGYISLQFALQQFIIVLFSPSNEVSLRYSRSPVSTALQ